MLLNIDPRISPDLLYCLASMGHGDELAIVDANFPANSTARAGTHAQVIGCLGQSGPETMKMVLELLPLDAFYDYSALYMEIDDTPGGRGEVHEEFLGHLRGKLPENGKVLGIDRQKFYKQARRSFAIIQTGEIRPFGCAIVRKGVVF